jgi:uncharacterized protein (TIGR00730 family)
MEEEITKSVDLKAWEGQIDSLVEELSKGQKSARVQAARDIFRTAAKLAIESPGTLNLKITASALRELRYSFKMFHPNRYTPKITMFGSARVPSDTPLYEFAKDFAVQAVKRKYMIITGGGPGIMAAGNEGAEEKGGFGLNIRLPMEQEPNPFIDPEKKLIHYKYFFTRKLFLVKEAAAFAFFPGGFGTFDEAFEVLTLLQTGKTNIIPVVMLEPKGYGFWTSCLDFINKEVAGRGFISTQDSSLYKVCHSSKEAIDHFDLFYKVYHSMRLVRGKVVIRLKKTMTKAVIEKINKEFSYLSKEEPMILGSALPEENNEPELAKLPRLIFPFDRRDFSGLRRLIDVINNLA